MRLWVDVVNEAHARFWRRFLRKYDAPVLLTTRRKGSLVDLLKAMMPERELVVCGEWGANDYEKLIKFAERVRELALLVEDVALAISKGSVEQARVAFGLSIPYVAMNDNDLHPHIVTKLTFPLASVSIIPECFRGPIYGEAIRFRGVFEVAHVLDYLESGEFAPSELDLSEGEYLIVRDPPLGSHYLKEAGPFERALERIERELGLPIVRLRREGLIELPGGRVVRASIDGLSLIEKSAGVISGGGTMAREAALLGVPSISIFPREEPCVSEELIEAGLLVKTELSSLIEAYADLKKLWERGVLKERAFNFMKSCEDPVDVAISIVRRLLSS